MTPDQPTFLSTRFAAVARLSIACLLITSSCGCGRAAEPPKVAAAEPPVRQMPGWRGDGSGRFPDATPPTQWSREENVLWRTQLPAWSNASPVVAGDRVFVCAEPSTLICVNAADGAILWQKSNGYLDILAPAARAEAEAQIAAAEATGKELLKAERDLRRHRAAKKDAEDQAEHARVQEELERRAAMLKAQMGAAAEFRLPPTQTRVNGYSTPTPATDGERVHVLFGNGVAACYTLAGERLWARVIERPENDFGQGASPILAGGKLLVQINRLHALDAATGATLWDAETRHAWGAPVVLHAGENVVATAGGGVFRLADGVQLSRKSARVSHASPVVADGVLYFIENKAHAVQLLESRKKDRIKAEFIWSAELPGRRYFASPVVESGRIYAVDEPGTLSVTDAATGALLHQRALVSPEEKATFYSSLASAGGLIFVTAENGTTHVLRDSAGADPVAVNRLEPLRSSPTLSGRRIYLRTLDALWCIGR